jgi:predicted transglutaminase-like cysteine proteinase
MGELSRATLRRVWPEPPEELGNRMPVDPHHIPLRRAHDRLRQVCAIAAGLAITLLAAQAHASGPNDSVFISTKSSVSAPSGASDLCQRYAWACQGSALSPVSAQTLLPVARKVNRSVNGRVRSIADSVQYGAKEVWTLPSPRGGDCEDYALLKKHDLIGKGVPAQRLLLATVFGQRTGSHAVLILRLDEGDYVLDNMTDDIKPWSKTKYTFLRIQDPGAPERWKTVFASN